MYPDKNQDDPDEPDDPVPQIQYGRLRYIVSFELPAFRQAGGPFNQPKTYRLAYVQPCRIAHPGDATNDLIEFSSMRNTPIFVQVGVIECSVGRVKTPDGWCIVDRSSEWARTIFTPEDVAEVVGEELVY